jgi:hypothetical protein
MKKLSLVIEDLKVETFAVHAGEEETGTVVAHQLSGDAACNTRDDNWCSTHYTRNVLDYHCYASEGGGYCSAVCPTGYEVCDTSPEMCG